MKTKSILSCIAVCLLAISTLTGQSLPTMVSGGIYNDVTWTLSGSPYVITSSIVVFPGRTLTIEPGVEVLVKEQPLASTNKNYLEVRGNIVAVGTPTAPIKFQGESMGTDRGLWKGIVIKFVQGATANFDYIHVKNSEHSIVADDIRLDTTTLNNCVFMYNDIGYNPYSSFIMNNCVFMNNGTACNGVVTWYQNHFNSFQNCIFQYNSEAIAYMGGTTSINNCLIKNNNGGIVSYLNGNVENTTFKDNVVAANNCSNANFLSCTFENNGTAINYFQAGTINDCNFIKNDLAIGLGSYVNIFNNTMDSNTVAVKLYEDPQGFRDNQICNSLQYIIEHQTDRNYSLEENCFCGADSATIEAKIKDGYDDITKGLLNYAVYDSTCTNILSMVIKVNLTTAIDEVKENAVFQVYPNPASSSFTIQALQTDIQIAEVRIIDLMGREFVHQTMDIQAQPTIDLTHLPSGIYLLYLTSNHQQEMVRFTKQ